MSPRQIDPRDLDVEMYPCMVAGCEDHATGWVDRAVLEWMRIDLETLRHVDRVYLCSDHIRPVKRGPSDA